MKRFDRIKTVQLVLLIVFALVALLTVLGDGVLYAQIAADAHTRLLAILLWALLGLSFLFLLYDFSSYANLKRENLELDNAIYADALTGIANRYSVDVYIAQYMNKPLPADMGCVTLELTNLGEINAAHGHSGGDAAIRDFSEILVSASNGVCFTGRNGGNKFVALFRDCTDKRLDGFLGRIAAGVEDYNKAHPDAVLRYNSGTAFREGEAVSSVTELVALSDHRLTMRD